jgi:hypothetical protein
VLGVSASRISLAACILALAALAAPGARAALWVSPSGDDRAPGSEEEPVRTIARARDLVRGLNRDMADDITVFIAGEHHLEQPLAFGPEDTATNGYSIIYTAAPGEHPVVSGGIRITGWGIADAARNLWAAPVPDGQAPARELFVNGTPVSQTCGRLLQFFSKKTDAVPAAQPDPAANWKNPADVVFEPVEPGGIWSEREGVVPVFVRNAFELLGKPGEWYFDRPARRLYYTPRPGETMATADVEAAVAPALVEIRGSAGHPVAGLIFKGIRFEYAAGPGGRADAVPALAVSNAASVQFLEDEFLHIGSGALQFGPAVTGSGTDASLFADIGGAAVRIAGASQVRIAESRFTYAAGRRPFAGVIEVDGSQDVTIEHSQVDHYPLEAVQRTGAPSGTILEDSNLIAPPMIALHGAPAEAQAPGQGDTGVPQAYQALLSEAVGAPTVPRAPGSVAAEAEDGFAYVTWMPSCLDGGSPVTGYTVEASNGAKVAVSADDFLARGYVVFGDLGNGRPVSFTVTASSATGASAPSLPTAAVRPLRKRKLKAPAAPASVSIAPTGSGVRLRIAPPPSDGGSPVVSYAVISAADAERDVLEGLDVIHADEAHPVVRRIDGISPAHAAAVTVEAVNAAGEGDPAPAKVR